MRFLTKTWYYKFCELRRDLYNLIWVMLIYAPNSHRRKKDVHGWLLKFNNFNPVNVKNYFHLSAKSYLTCLKSHLWSHYGLFSAHAQIVEILHSKTCKQTDRDTLVAILNTFISTCLRYACIVRSKASH